MHVAGINSSKLGKKKILAKIHPFDPINHELHETLFIMREFLEENSWRWSFKVVTK